MTTGISLVGGEELDAFIEQKVFGRVPCNDWRAVNFGSIGGPGFEQACGHGRDECYCAKTTGSMGGKVGGPRPFTTNMEAAMQIVDRLADVGASKSTNVFSFSLFHACSLSSVMHGYLAIFDYNVRPADRTQINEKEVSGFYRHETPAMAVCVAALMALKLVESPYKKKEGEDVQ
jgi:hypothetical protein